MFSSCGENTLISEIWQRRISVFGRVSPDGERRPMAETYTNCTCPESRRGELPTTVIVDAQGNVRRRFIGARNLAVFEAMWRRRRP
jgi:hypothetical protein